MGKMGGKKLLAKNSLWLVLMPVIVKSLDFGDVFEKMCIQTKKAKTKPEKYSKSTHTTEYVVGLVPQTMLLRQYHRI